MASQTNTGSADDHDVSRMARDSFELPSETARDDVDDEDPEIIEEFLPGLGVSVLGGIGLLIVAAIVVAVTLL